MLGPVHYRAVSYGVGLPLIESSYGLGKTRVASAIFSKLLIGQSYG